MKPGQWLRAYVPALLVLVVADYLWLGTVMVDFYHQRMGDLLLPLPRIVPAVLFYLMYIAGVCWFVLRPALFLRSSLKQVALQAALFGVVAYGTYDLSNYATLRVWSLDLTLADMTWGGFISALAALAGFVAARRRPVR